MLSKRMFETGFTAAMNEELEERQMTVQELAARTGIPASTLSEITTGEHDPRFSTIKTIIAALEPARNQFIAVIGAPFLLDLLDIREIDLEGDLISIRRYPASSLEDCIIAAVQAERDGAAGIICPPILTPIIEKTVVIPVGTLRPEQPVNREVIRAAVRGIG